MPLADEHIAETITLLLRRQHAFRIPLRSWKVCDEGSRTQPPPPARFRHVRLPAAWGGYDVTTWFAADVVVPEQLAGLAIELHVDVHEGLLFVDGEAIQGLDCNHRDVLLTRRATPGERFRVLVQAYSGRERRKRTFRGALLQSVDPVARSLVVSLGVLRDAARQPRADGDAIGAMLESVCSMLRGAHPMTRDAMCRAAETLKAARARAEGDTRCATVHLIGHSHIDVVWLWTLEETRRKCARTFSTALRLMEEFPAFRFTQSQALLYEYTRQQYPSLYRKIKRRVSQGRWEVTGSTWVEPDCNIPNGESLIRQVVYGKQFFLKEFGIDTQVLWLPDTFGYSWALPQILAKAGVRYFCTTKLTWNDTTVFPLSTFWWKGVDGTAVLTHLPSVGLEGQARPEDLVKGCDGLRHRELCRHTLQTYGHGDGGGGVTREHVLSVEALHGCPGLPETRVTSVEEFFRAAESCGKDLPTWEDELYLEMHRGTYTTHGWIKRANRRAEYRLYTAELLSALARIVGQRSYPARQLECAWKRLLLNQFHDIVPGTSIQEAYGDARRDFESVEETCEKTDVKALPAFIRRASPPALAWTVFNPSSWTRSDYVELHVRGSAPSYDVHAADGRPVPCQVIGRREGNTRLLCYLEDVLPFTFTGLQVVPRRDAGDLQAWDLTEDRARTPRLDFRMDEAGRIWSIVDRQTGHEAVRPGCAANDLQAFIDRPAIWETWEITREAFSRQVSLFRPGGVTVGERGPLRARLRVRFRSRRGSRIVQDILAYHQTGRLDFRTSVQWREHQHLLKVAFPANVDTDHAIYEIQLGALRRSSRPVSPADEARYEVPAQQWADVSDGVHGAAVMNDCKYGYDAAGGTLRLTLIRSPHYPHPVTPMNKVDRRFTDQGGHEFTYALLPHAGDWRAARVVHRAREFNLGLRAFAGRVHRPTAPLAWDSAGVLVDAVKWADDGRGVVVRAHEAYGLSGVARLAVTGRIRRAEECDLLERPGRPLDLAGTSELELQFSPFELKTIRLVTSP